ncbi:MAG: hypothetical protein V7668_16555 [Cereibacter changlensis]
MDFTRFDSRAAAETPRALHLRHPASGEPLYADAERKKPCRVLVVGTESRAAQAELHALHKARMTEAKPGEAGASLEEVQAGLVRSARPLIRGFENVSRGERPASLEDVDWFLNLNLINGREGEAAFVEQVMGFATSRASFLGNGSPG